MRYLYLAVPLVCLSLPICAEVLHIDELKVVQPANPNGSDEVRGVLQSAYGHFENGSCQYDYYDIFQEHVPLQTNKTETYPTMPDDILEHVDRGFQCVKYTVWADGHKDQSATDEFRVTPRGGTYVRSYESPFIGHMSLIVE